jgi:hypothetical protein
MLIVIFGIMIMGGHVVFMIGLFSKKSKLKNKWWKKKITLQVDKICYLSNVPMVLLSIQRWERLVVKIQNTLEFYPIKYKDVSWMSFQNIESKV